MREMTPQQFNDWTDTNDTSEVVIVKTPTCVKCQKVIENFDKIEAAAPGTQFAVALFSPFDKSEAAARMKETIISLDITSAPAFVYKIQRDNFYKLQSKCFSTYDELIDFLQTK
jgi:thiol-disulfide isomerase/thioredoxin